MTTLDVVVAVCAVAYLNLGIVYSAVGMKSAAEQVISAAW